MYHQRYKLLITERVIKKISRTLFFFKVYSNAASQIFLLPYESHDKRRPPLGAIPTPSNSVCTLILYISIFHFVIIYALVAFL